MKNHVEKTTNNYTKIKGQIICNKGEQAKEVLSLLLSHKYKAEDISQKKSKAMIKYIKE